MIDAEPYTKRTWAAFAEQVMSLYNSKHSIKRIAQLLNSSELIVSATINHQLKKCSTIQINA